MSDDLDFRQPKLGYIATETNQLVRQSKRLTICTDNEDDWTEFFEMCGQSFQESIPFKRSHPDSEKRRQFIKAYFEYLYKTEFSDGRAGLACVKMKTESGQEEIIYGLVGVYQGSKKCEGDKLPMIAIDPDGAEIALREDEWIQRNFRDGVEEMARVLGCPWIYFAIQASKYRNQGITTEYFLKAGEMVGFDGMRRQIIPRGLRVVAYTVLDDPMLKDFYIKVGMVKIAQGRGPTMDRSRCSESRSCCVAECSCFYLMYRGYPEKDYFAEDLKQYFQALPNDAEVIDYDLMPPSL